VGEETQRRRMLDQLGDAPTFVAAGSRLAGDLETLGPLVVCGSVRGDGRVGGALSMAAGAEWHGEVHAQAAVIAGRLTGRLVVEGKLEVGETAVIQADVVARTIAIARGAVIEGAMTVTSGQPVVRFQERRRGEESMTIRKIAAVSGQ
jgi:cytoskeletal protein CcmA (bactofilin family)